jgi:hypothetical protein
MGRAGIEPATLGLKVVGVGFGPPRRVTSFPEMEGFCFSAAEAGFGRFRPSVVTKWSPPEAMR